MGRFDDAENTHAAVFQAIGAASMCWETIERAGVFNSDRTKEIAEDLLAFLDAHQPLLGFATTRQLIHELAARAEVAESVGETWPLYRTVDVDS